MSMASSQLLNRRSTGADIFTTSPPGADAVFSDRRSQIKDMRFAIRELILDDENIVNNLEGEDALQGRFLKLSKEFDDLEERVNDRDLLIEESDLNDLLEDLQSFSNQYAKVRGRLIREVGLIEGELKQAESEVAAAQDSQVRMLVKATADGRITRAEQMALVLAEENVKDEIRQLIVLQRRNRGKKTGQSEIIAKRNRARMERLSKKRRAVAKQQRKSKKTSLQACKARESVLLKRISVLEAAA